MTAGIKSLAVTPCKPRIKFDCDQCEYKATTKSNLRVHILSIHEGIIFDCAQCVYKATQKSSLSNKEHKKSKHERIKYSCDQCEYKTSYKQALRIHKQSKHGDIKIDFGQ